MCPDSAQSDSDVHPQDEHRPDLVGDGWDPEPLWTAEQVARFLGVPVKSVYELPIRRVKISSQRVRWWPVDVLYFAVNHMKDP